MLSLIIGLFTRIFSNSYLNVFQKMLTNRGELSSIVNFYTYLGLSIISFSFSQNIIYTPEILSWVLIMGFLGMAGNYSIIKALSCGELSTLAPINSFKPIVALVLGIIFLGETPRIIDLLGILLIIFGTILLSSGRTLFSKALLFRLAALIFSGMEAIIIKKVILLSDITSAFFYWACSGLFFTFIIACFSKHSIKISSRNIKYQLYLVIAVALMQYSTNYVFAKMNVAHALAIFQLSTILSVFLGANVFKEKGLFQKLKASLFMIIGALILILL